MEGAIAAGAGHPRRPSTSVFRFERALLSAGLLGLMTLTAAPAAAEQSVDRKTRKAAWRAMEKAERALDLWERGTPAFRLSGSFQAKSSEPTEARYGLIWVSQTAWTDWIDLPGGLRHRRGADENGEWWLPVAASQRSDEPTRWHLRALRDLLRGNRQLRPRLGEVVSSVSVEGRVLRIELSGRRDRKRSVELSRYTGDLLRASEGDCLREYSEHVDFGRRRLPMVASLSIRGRLEARLELKALPLGSPIEENFLAPERSRAGQRPSRPSKSFRNADSERHVLRDDLSPFSEDWLDDVMECWPR